MNKLKTILFAVCSLVLVSIGTSVKADSGNFAGPYIGITASGWGIEAEGTSNSSTVSEDSTSTTSDKVHLGKVGGVAGWEVGYALPLGSAFLLDIGATYGAGEATIDHDNDSGDGGLVTFTVDDFVTVYLAPTMVLSDTSSIYLKMAISEADVKTSGDITEPGNLSGETWAIGTRTVLDSGIFIRTEAGYTDYNSISASGLGGSQPTSNTYSVEPSLAYGTVSLGFRF